MNNMFFVKTKYTDDFWLYLPITIHFISLYECETTKLLSTLQELKMKFHKYNSNSIFTKAYLAFFTRYINEIMTRKRVYFETSAILVYYVCAGWSSDRTRCLY